MVVTNNVMFVLFRRRFYARKIDSEVARVREELNGISLETCITMLYSQLRG